MPVRRLILTPGEATRLALLLIRHAIPSVLRGRHVEVSLDDDGTRASETSRRPEG
jgi:hypothetical protein